jgi:hypothetical protein
MTTAHDKHGHAVSTGDIVEVVHFGEHHTFAVEEIHEDHGHHYLTGSVTIRVPSTATERRKGQNPPDAPREDTKVQHHTPQTPEQSQAKIATTERRDAREESHRTTHITAPQAKPIQKGKS